MRIYKLFDRLIFGAVVFSSAPAAAPRRAVRPQRRGLRRQRGVAALDELEALRDGARVERVGPHAWRPPRRRRLAVVAAGMRRRRRGAPTAAISCAHRSSALAAGRDDEPPREQAHVARAPPEDAQQRPKLGAQPANGDAGRAQPEPPRRPPPPPQGQPRVGRVLLFTHDDAPLSACPGTNDLQLTCHNLS